MDSQRGFCYNQPITLFSEAVFHMDWTLLGIEPTKDKKIITTAYRSRLTTVNPEDKPEEFKALRAAYEEALRLADQEETPPRRQRAGP